MDIVLTSIAFVIAAVCAGLMGFAIQRGATCTVAAVDEVVAMRGFARLRSMFEASLWVAGGLVLARMFALPEHMPVGYPVTSLTVVGGVLLGFGAYINRACVFGAIARLGSGEWAYAVTPFGFYVGCVSVGHVFAVPARHALPYGSPILEVSSLAVLPFVAFVVWRAARALLASPAAMSPRTLLERSREGLATRVWSPHAATIVIGITFVVMLLLVGAWAYTDVLAELARGMAANLVARTLLLVALFSGAMVGGYTAGRFRSTPIALPQLAKCFGGGLLMGWGTLLIPGGNDGLILVGMPLLWPYAWVAFLTMCVTIGAALLVEKSVTAAAVSE